MPVLAHVPCDKASLLRMKRPRTSGLFILAIAALVGAALTVLFFAGTREEPEAPAATGTINPPPPASHASAPAAKRPPRPAAPVHWCEAADAAREKSALPTLISL